MGCVSAPYNIIMLRAFRRSLLAIRNHKPFRILEGSGVLMQVTLFRSYTHNLVDLGSTKETVSYLRCFMF